MEVEPVGYELTKPREWSIGDRESNVKHFQQDAVVNSMSIEHRTRVE